jgi:hypothetical protein
MRLGRNIGLLGTEFGFSGTNFRVFGNKNTGFQEPMARVFRNSLNGLSGTRPYTKSPKSQGNLQTFTDITRARDLNSINNPLTPTHTRRLKRGLRPLGASNPPNPPYPHKEGPTGNPKPKYRAAALKAAGK